MKTQTPMPADSQKSHSMNATKRCPFCGSTQGVSLMEDGEHRQVECTHCGARGPKVAGERAAERAVMLWNNLIGVSRR